MCATRLMSPSAREQSSEAIVRAMEAALRSAGVDCVIKAVMVNTEYTSFPAAVRMTIKADLFSIETVVDGVAQRRVYTSKAADASRPARLINLAGDVL